MSTRQRRIIVIVARISACQFVVTEVGCDETQRQLLSTIADYNAAYIIQYMQQPIVAKIYKLYTCCYRREIDRIYSLNVTN